jgi:hypothetical protein
LSGSDLQRVQRLGLHVAARAAAQAAGEDRAALDDDGHCFAAVLDDLHRVHAANVSTSPRRSGRSAQF